MSIQTQIPSAELPATTNIINQSTINNDGNVNQSNSNPSSSISPSKARRRRKRNNKNKNKNQNQNQNQNNGNETSQNSSKSNTKSNKKKRQKPSPKQAANPKPKAKSTNIAKLDRVELSNKSKKNPWSKKQQSSAFENIMSEQAQTQNPIYAMPQMNDEQLLEQQMIAMAIAASKKEQQELQLKEYQKYSKNDDEKQAQQDKNKEQEKEQKEEIISTSVANEDEEKQMIENNTPKPTINDELIAATINAQANINGDVKIEDQTLSDKALAIQLQQQEQREYNRKQKMSRIYDGKYAKVTSSATKPTTIPKAALNFYYDDDSMLNGGLTKEQYQQHLMSTQASEESIVDENTNTESVADTEETGTMKEELVAISKHDAKIWSETHIDRLNEYEVGGNLGNLNMNIGNKAYNSIRNQLDKKGYITYHNYQLEPSDRKR